MTAKRKYIEEHTADILFQAEASTLGELFQECAMAVEESQLELNNVSQEEVREINDKNKNVEYLLFDFLGELLVIKDSEQLIFSKFEIKVEKIDENYVMDCKAFGEKINPQKHEQKVDVKAITMHLFEVKKEEGKWNAQVLIDI
jgi:SHS2 domain-containing protein